MPDLLHALIVEDLLADAELLVRELRRGGFEVVWKRVQTEPEFISALKEVPDIILADYHIPHFGAPRVLEIMREQNRNIPVILVTGAIGEEEAVSIIKNGAVDYILKDRLVRLGEAVRRALEEKKLRKEKQKSELRNELLSLLGLQLSSARTMEEAARIIVTVADKFFSWDSCYLDIYSTKEDKLYPIINMDVIDGQRQDAPLSIEDTMPSPFIRRVMKEGSKLILRDRALFSSDLKPIGNRSKPSASLMFAPIRHDSNVVGIFSIQSYTEQAYDEDDLKTFQFLTDFCSATLERMIAQNTLSRVEENYRQLVEQLPAITYTLDFDKAPPLSFISPRIQSILGFSAEEWLANPTLWVDRLHPDERRRVIEEFKLRDSFNQPIDTDYRLITCDGQIRWFHDRCQFIYDSNEKPIYAHGILFDITERKRAELERQVLLEIMQGLASTENLQDFLKLVHHTIAKVIYAENFFTIFYNEDSGLFEEVYSVDKYDPPSPPSKLEKSISAYVFRSGDPLLLTQDFFDELAAKGEVQLIGTNSPSWLGIPLKKGSKTIGVMVVQDYEQLNRYSEHDKDFLASIAGQVTLAIERVQIEDALHRSLEESKRGQILLLALNNVIQAVQRAHTATEVYKEIAGGMSNLSYGVWILRLTEDGTGLSIAYTTVASKIIKVMEKFTGLSAANYTLPLVSGSFLQEAIQTGKTISMTVDAKEIAKVLPPLLRFLAGRIAQILGPNYFICAPLVTNSKAHGLLAVSGPRLSEIDIPAISTFAAQASIALENTSLYEKVQNELVERKQAEMALLESEKRFRGLFNTSPDAILLIDPHHPHISWPIIDCNPAACQMNGYTREELIGQSVDVMNITPGSPIERNVYLDRLRHEGVIHTETLHRHKDGHIFPIEISSSLISLEGRELILGIDRDITKRKTAETEIKQRLAELEAVSRVSTSLRTAQTLNEMLPRLMEETIAVLGGTGGSIWFLEESSNEIRAVYQHNRNGESSPLKRGESIVGYVIATGQPYLSQELKIDSKIPENMRPNIPSGMSGICVPIWTSNQIIGALFISTESPNEFIDADVHLLITLAEMAGNAIHRMYLHEQTRQRAEEFSKLYEAAHALAGQIDLPLVLDTIVDRSVELLGASNGTIALYDPAKGVLELAAKKNFPLALGTQRKLGEGMAGYVAQSRQPLTLENYHAWEGRNPALENYPLTSAMEVPMIYHNELIGTLGVGEVNTIRKFTRDDLNLLSLFAAQAAGAVQNAKLFNQTRQRLDRIAALHAIDTAISSSFDLKLLLSVIVNKVADQLMVDACDILLLDPASNILEFGAGHGLQSVSDERPVSLSDNLSGDVILKGKIVSLPDLRSYKDHFIRSKLPANEGFVAYYGVPLISKNKPLGVLEIFHRQPLIPDTDWLDYLETLAGQAAIAIDNATLFSDLQLSNRELTLAYEATIAGWSHALDLRDKETEGHTQRVTTLTVTLARGFGLSEEEIINVRRGALLHDIGKMGVPDSILLKSGPLTVEEWEIMRQHPIFAYDMLSAIEYLKPALDIPYCHHEKWDGTGYPQGLRGTEIPLAARIFAVVDVWDALRSDRPYRKAWPSEQVIAHLRTLTGTHFDPYVIETILESGIFGDTELDLSDNTCGVNRALS